MSQMIGDWNFRISEPKSGPEECRVEQVGAHFVKEVAVHLDLDKLARLAVPDNAYQLTLTGDVNGGSNSASWSPIYDEGLIVRYQEGNKWITLYGQFKYIPDKKVTTPSSGVQEDGTTPGYTSHCETIFRGWAISEDTPGAGEKSVSCLSASKVVNDRPAAKVEPSGHARSSDPQTTTGSLRPHDRSAKAASSGPAPPSNHATTLLPPLQYHIEYSPPDVQQQNCGSCYVYAFAYALERSFEKQLSAIPGGSVAHINLDRQVMLSCAYSSEGCAGGYFESLTLDMSVRGIPTTAPIWTPKKSDVPSPTAQTPQGCPTDRLQDKTALYYPKTFISLQSEREIKESLVHNGPVLVSVYMLQHQEVGGERIRRLLRSPRSPQSVTEWDYVNHGIVIISWGEKDGSQYWIAYNPWGVTEHIQMGGESEWIYKYAVSIVPDLCRGAPLQVLGAARTSAGCQTNAGD